MKKKTSKAKPKRASKSPARKPVVAKKVKLGEAWREEFIANEHRAKKGEKPLTDDQLAERMAKRFPAKAKRSTILRVSGMRSFCNRGTNLFKRFGPCRPQSNGYNGDDHRRKPRVEARSKRPAKRFVLKPRPAATPVRFVLKRRAG